MLRPTTTASRAETGRTRLEDLEEGIGGHRAALPRRLLPAARRRARLRRWWRRAHRADARGGVRLRLGVRELHLLHAPLLLFCGLFRLSLGGRRDDQRCGGRRLLRRKAPEEAHTRQVVRLRAMRRRRRRPRHRREARARRARPSSSLCAQAALAVPRLLLPSRRRRRSVRAGEAAGRGAVRSGVPAVVPSPRPRRHRRANARRILQKPRRQAAVALLAPRQPLLLGGGTQPPPPLKLLAQLSLPGQRRQARRHGPHELRSGGIQALPMRVAPRGGARALPVFGCGMARALRAAPAPAAAATSFLALVPLRRRLEQRLQAAARLGGAQEPLLGAPPRPAPLRRGPLL